MSEEIYSFSTPEEQEAHFELVNDTWLKKEMARLKKETSNEHGKHPADFIPED